MTHHFDIHHAKKYGLPEAIILQNILFWLAHNKAFKKNIIEGKPWTFNSVTAYSKLFPYFTADKIRRYIESLIEQGVLIVGNHNTKNYDKTRWFTVADESLIPYVETEQNSDPVANSPDGCGETAKPIPDRKQNRKQRAAKASPPAEHPKSQIVQQAEILIEFIEKSTGHNLKNQKSLIGVIINRLRQNEYETVYETLKTYIFDDYRMKNRRWSWFDIFKNQMTFEEYRTKNIIAKPKKIISLQPDNDPELYTV